jgi:hypothetical protein
MTPIGGGNEGGTKLWIEEDTTFNVLIKVRWFKIWILSLNSSDIHNIFFLHFFF